MSLSRAVVTARSNSPWPVTTGLTEKLSQLLCLKELTEATIVDDGGGAFA